MLSYKQFMSHTIWNQVSAATITAIDGTEALVVPICDDYSINKYGWEAYGAPVILTNLLTI